MLEFTSIHNSHILLTIKPSHLINRRTKEFSQEDIRKIANTYHRWRSFPSPNLSQGERQNSLPLGEMSEGQRGYENIKGFCFSASIDRVRELDYCLLQVAMLACPMMKMILILMSALQN